ncbi:MAG: bifunctional cytidylyltransferase/SDR family oxidoreductase [Bacteroidales bacterium]|nr:bifunctional cytidylyltransferase/SDR family oxidoreductase [Bacteroidales bacterium]
MNIAVILAGGVGSRLGYSIPKQFFKVAGKTIIEHTIDVFDNNSLIDEIAIVIHPLYIDEMESIVVRNQWKKVKKILKGGNERYMSTLSAIMAYEGCDECNMIFHDAVRPLVNNNIIKNVVEALKTFDAVDVAVPATDTIIEVDEDGKFIDKIPKRKLLRRGQTPQAFKYSIIAQAYEKALKDPDFISTDDCGTVVKYMPDVKIFVVEGEESNMKLTYKEDLFLLDKLFQLRSTTLHDEIDFSKLSDKVIAVFGGNSGIGKEIVDTTQKYGAKVYSFSRSTTGTDVANRYNVDAALAMVANENGKIDYIVNCAAILSKEPLISMDTNLISTIIRTNYDGMVNVAMSAFQYLKESHGQLLLYTSSSYTRGRAFYSIYSSTKAAAVNFMQALAQEWESYGIRVNVINPERTNTPMRTKNFGIEPPDTLLEASEVAEVSLKTLLLDITGQVVDVKIKKN